VRVGASLASGPAGAPPPNGRAFEVGNASPVGVLSRYAGALFYDRVAAKGYICKGGSAWADVEEISRVAGVEVIVADSFSPVVSGFASPVGTRLRTADGTKAWLKYGTGDYDWRPLTETRASVVSSAGPVQNVDLPVAVAADESVEFWADAERTASVEWTKMRLNQAAAVVTSGTYGQGTPWDGNAFLMGVAGGSYGRGGCHVKLGPSVDGVRSVEFTYWSKSSNANCGFGTGRVTAGALTHVGFGLTSAGVVDGATVRAVVGKSLPDSPGGGVSVIDVAAGGALKYGGVNALRALTALHDLFLGPSGNMTMTGRYNLTGGDDAGAATTTGSNKVLFGASAGKDGTVAQNKIAIGVGAGEKDLDADGNVDIGTLAGNENVHGSYGTRVGHLAGQKSQGDYVTVLGMHAGTFLTTGERDTGTGAGSLRSTQTGNRDTANGFHAGALNVSGDDNFWGGDQAGFPDAVENPEAADDDQMTMVGANSGRASGVTGKMTNSIAIGYNTRVSKSNQAVLGNASVTETVLRGTVIVPVLQVSDVPEYADNAAAVAGGLSIGRPYRTGDVLKVVHA